MAEKLLIMGPSGTGKSHSIQYLDPTKTVIICPDRKVLPFRGSLKMYKTVYKDGLPPLYANIAGAKSNYIETNAMSEVSRWIRLIAVRRPEITTIIVDTITYAMVESVMREIKNKDFGKFTTFAEELYNILNVIPDYRADLTVVFMAHVENENIDGQASISFKIPAGKFTREKIVPEGLFTAVLYTESVKVDGKPTYFFNTQNSGTNTCKSPEGMFPELRIDNNLKYVIECMKAYYNNEAAPAPIKAVKIASDQDDED